MLLVSMEDMAFKKYTALYRLEERHGVELGNAYKLRTQQGYLLINLAQHQRNSCKATLSKAHFFSFLMDGSMDAGNVQDKIFILLHCFKDDKGEETLSYAIFFQYKCPRKLMLILY